MDLIKEYKRETGVSNSDYVSDGDWFTDYAIWLENRLSTSYNSYYAKCCDDIETIMMYRGEMPEQGKLIEILKKHFA